MAMEDAIALARALSSAPGAVGGTGGDGRADLAAALAAYEAERRPVIARIQKAARDSQAWFENVARYAAFEPVPFAFSLLTRSRRISYENLRRRDPELIRRVRQDFARRALPDLASPDEGPLPMFTPFPLRSLTLRNRVVVSPMCMYSAEDGLISDFHLVHLGSRALGGAGLVMTEMTCVAADARISPGCAGLYRPEHADAWRRVVEFVHRHTRAAIGMQLGHAGRKGATKLAWEGSDEPLAEGGWPLIAPSPLAWSDRNQVPREMDRADMDRVTAAFVAAARAAARVGFDLLELHMAHGYLLASFLSPLTNRRQDAYGGSLRNRMRFPLELVDAVRSAWPAERPLSVRISATDWLEGGLVVEDAVELARALRAAGVDIVDVSTGLTVPEARPVYGRSFQTPFSDQIRNEAQVPTIAVGNISSADEVNSILAAGRADLCALARPHLYDPYFTLHAAAELGDPEPWPLPYRAASRPRRTEPA
jgi:anthraniloyl-CoA monooxygenase